MEWKVRMQKTASQDYGDIIKWTRKSFGEKQAQTYRVTLNMALEALRDGPNIVGVKQRDDIASGILTLHVARQGRKGRHFLLFRICSEQIIDVLRLLHDSMDLEHHLP